MDKLLSYLNSLDRQQRKEFCERLDTTEGYLRKACSTKQKLHPKLCSRIERESAAAVRRLDLLDEDECIEIWPDLAQLLTEDRRPAEAVPAGAEVAGG